ncbi:MAG: MFS transporter [Actinomycetia bacterium]|nr:MFS transporter [Actinomycetes bacterium]
MRNRGYLRLVGASTISNLGDGIGIIAYPWLASGVTRNATLIALVAAAQRLPWLLFSLPAGVITDRVDRRRLMVSMDSVRAALTLGVAAFVAWKSSGLPGPAELESVSGTNVSMYVVVLVATLLLGCAEVLRDNASQTFLPAVVDKDDLEKANGRLWSAELVANSFAGPPLGSLLIGVAFALPFFVDAATFAVAAGIVASIPGDFTPQTNDDRAPWRDELKEGLRWLWSHELLRPLAITLGVLNMLGMIPFATLVLFGQEVLDTSATEFALLGTGAAVGGVIGGFIASPVAKRVGEGPLLLVTLIGGGAINIVIGLQSNWMVVWFFFGLAVILGVVWNVITVSLRQTVIPDGLLGRVNSVYRFFGWGMMPLGSLLGGLVVAFGDGTTSRETALRLPWLLSGLLHIVLLLYAAPRLTSAKVAAAREQAATAPN